MNPLPALDHVHLIQGIGERSGRQPQGDADAFRRAMQQQGGDQPPPDAETPKPTALQQKAAACRKTAQGELRHVDFLA